MREALGLRLIVLLFLVACGGGPGDAFVAGTPDAASGARPQALDGDTPADAVAVPLGKGGADNSDAATTSPVSADASAAIGRDGGVPSGADGGAADAPSGADGGAPDAFVIVTDAAPEPPRQMACGSNTCDEATQFCCVQAGGTESCQGTATACAGSRRECDKASDCPPGNVCCFDFSSQPASASCHSDCGGGGDTRVQACRTATECLSGACATHACVSGGSIESCAPFGAECP